MKCDDLLLFAYKISKYIIDRCSHIEERKRHIPLKHPKHAMQYLQPLTKAHRKYQVHLESQTCHALKFV
ncbi:hypothetical protein Hdeb2414_s0007g00227191 [Helianthus debilis subsp. tardiflorus]